MYCKHIKFHQYKIFIVQQKGKCVNVLIFLGKVFVIESCNEIIHVFRALGPQLVMTSMR